MDQGLAVVELECARLSKSPFGDWKSYLGRHQSLAFQTQLKGDERHELVGLQEGQGNHSKRQKIHRCSHFVNGQNNFEGVRAREELHKDQLVVVVHVLFRTDLEEVPEAGIVSEAVNDFHQLLRALVVLPSQQAHFDKAYFDPSLALEVDVPLAALVVHWALSYFSQEAQSFP